MRFDAMPKTKAVWITLLYDACCRGCAKDLSSGDRVLFHRLETVIGVMFCGVDCLRTKDEYAQIGNVKVLKGEH